MKNSVETLKSLRSINMDIFKLNDEKFNKKLDEIFEEIDKE